MFEGNDFSSLQEKAEATDILLNDYKNLDMIY